MSIEYETRHKGSVKKVDPLAAFIENCAFTNQAIDIDTLSRRVFAHGKASKRRCSTPTASFDNAVREQTHDGLSLNIIRLGATSVAQLGVAALDKGWAIPSLAP
ncbi:MAG: hypothetical protein ABW104_00100 [Candidatus Thiodiazotropha sp. 6PLUC2]